MRESWLVVAWLLAGLPAEAASLRTASLLDHSMVRLSDLFDDAGPEADRVLGPGPAPGERIVVEAAQLAAIARQFAVAWRPASASERVVLERPGREVPRDSVLAVLKDALVDAGASKDIDILLPGFAPPLVAPEAVPLLAIEQLQFDRASERFTATLTVTTARPPLQRVRLSGTVQEMTDAVVTTRRLPAGSVVTPGDVVVKRVRAQAWQQEMARTTGQAIGLAVRHMTQAGQPLPVADLAPPVAVQRGARVTMELRAPGLSISGIGTATEPGAIGDRIRVLNPASHAVVEAEVLATDLVRVLPEPGLRDVVPIRQELHR